MHELEPFYNWRQLYVASEDEASPFYGREYSEFMLSNAVYDYFIHPQWDEFGSATLYLKILYVGYELEYAVIEFIGEWNDTLYNDVMYLYRNVVEHLIDNGIRHFILIGENVMTFHSDTADYYEEWFDNIDDGWIVGLNFRDHVVEEFCSCNIDYYIAFKGSFDDFNWRGLMPDQLFERINGIINKRLGA
jgi:hypothetical protein